ncbi:MAG TPA: hypothetical protein VMX74_00190, partial [Pirellulales bacterium]|nr:hypothetical protein [Pirellulales bacterium]
GANAVKSWSDDFASSIGRSKKQVAEFMAGTQDLFVPLGFAADSALELSKQVTELAIDLASFNNMNDEDVIRDFHAALTGSGEVMKKYGVIVSEAAVKQDLLQRGLDPTTATNQMKVQSRLNIIMAGTTAAQGDAARSAGSFANQMKALRAKLTDAADVIGTHLLPTVTELVTKTAEVIRKIGEFATNNKVLFQTLAKIALGVVAAGIALIVFGGLLSTVSTIAAAMASMLTIALNPLAWIVAAIGVAVVETGAIIAAGVVLFAKYTDAGKKMVEWFRDKFAILKTTVGDTMTGIKDAIQTGNWKLAGEIAWTGLKLAWFQMVDDLRSKWIDFNRWWVDSVLSMAQVVARINPDWEKWVRDYRDAWDDGFDSQIAAGAARIEELKQELERLRRVANAAVGRAEDDAYSPERGSKAAGAVAPSPVAIGAGGSSGTFSAAAAAIMFRGTTTEKKIEENTRRTAAEFIKLNRQRALGLRFI